MVPLKYVQKLRPIGNVNDTQPYQYTTAHVLTTSTTVLLHSMPYLAGFCFNAVCLSDNVS